LKGTQILDADFAIEVPHAFIARCDDVRSLSKLLSSEIGDVSFSAECADGVTRKFSSIDELIAFDNPRTKEIIRLKMIARSDDFKRRGEIDLSGSRRRGISIRIEGSDDVVVSLKESILEIVSSMRPMYSWLHRYDLVSVTLVIQMLIGVLPAIVVAVRATDVPISGSISERSAARVVLIGLVLPVVSIALGTFANRFRNSFFPKAFFAIGQSNRRLQKLETIQTAVVVGFFVSFAASVVVAVVQTWMA
jgi:hypothetical protein